MDVWTRWDYVGFWRFDSRIPDAVLVLSSYRMGWHLGPAFYPVDIQFPFAMEGYGPEFDSNRGSVVCRVSDSKPPGNCRVRSRAIDAATGIIFQLGVGRCNRAHY